MTEQQNNVLYITKKLRVAGVNDEGIAGILGNLEAESGIMPCRMQGDFGGPEFRKSKDYAASVDNGSISCDAFAKDAVGWGLAQFTYWTRKTELYSDAKNSGRSIADLSLQTDFIIKELKRDYPRVWGKLTQQKLSVEDYSHLICTDFERPAINNFSFRDAAARHWYAFIHEQQGSEEPEPQQEPKIVSWPPRTIDRGIEGWPEVWLLQALLCARGTVVLHDGIFGRSLEDKLKAFQSANGLKADGIAGPLTWAALGVSV